MKNSLRGKLGGLFLLIIAPVSIFAYSFVEETVIDNGPDSHRAVLADFNGDGNTDIAVTNGKTPAAIMISFGNGDGTFTSNTSLAMTTYPVGIDAKDVDGDADIDLVATNGYSNSIQLWTNDGTGSFSSLGTDVFLDSDSEVLFFDADDKNHLDLVVLDTSSGLVRVLIHDGSVYTEHSTHSVPTASREMVLADVVGDSGLDLILADHAGSVTVLPGMDVDFDKAETYTVGENIVDVASADFNGDGLNDIVALDAGKNPTVWLGINEGGDMFKFLEFSAGAVPKSLITVDVNQDGNQDVLVADNGSGSLIIMLGDGTGSLAQDTTHTIGTDVYHMTSGLLDDDTLPDVLVTQHESDNDLFLTSVLPPASPIVFLTKTSDPQATTTASITESSDDKPEERVSVYLDSKPAEGVEISCTVSDEKQITTKPEKLLYTYEKYPDSFEFQIITVDDEDVEGDHTVAINCTTSSADPVFDKQSATLTVTIIDNDIETIDAPVITVITGDTGASTTDGYTADNALVFSGTATSSSDFVELFLDGTSIGTTSVDMNGSWSIDYSATTLTDDTYQLEALATAGSTGSASSSPFSFTVDTVSPTPPVLVAIDEDTGSSSIDFITSDNQIIISGTSEPNSIVTIYLDGVAVGTTTSSTTGTYVFDGNLGPVQPDGIYEVGFDATDRAGNTSSSSATTTLTIDTTPPVITLIGATSTTISQGESFTDPGYSCVDVLDPACVITATGTVDVDTPGTYIITYTAIDSAGNSAFTTRAIIISAVTVSSSGGGGGSRYYCRDKSAINYTKRAGKTDNGLCRYETEEDSSIRDLLDETNNTQATIDSICSPLLTQTIALGRDNDTNEVKKLQRFLNEHEGESLSVDGIYNSDDFDAVKRFQAKHASSVLGAWGLSKPTGYVYLTTRIKINSFNCNKSLQCPVFKEYNSRSENTNTQEVQRTKIFMTEIGFYDGVINTAWDEGIHQSMVDFQDTFKATMLEPWGLTKGTGYKYKTTNKFLNEMVGCTTNDLVLENGRTVSY